MSRPDVHQVLAEWDASRDRSLTPEQQVVETALFLEDTFGITIPDNSLDHESLGTTLGMRAVLLRHHVDS